MSKHKRVWGKKRTKEQKNTAKCYVQNILPHYSKNNFKIKITTNESMFLCLSIYQSSIVGHMNKF
jgi:hypothetical protein